MGERSCRFEVSSKAGTTKEDEMFVIVNTVTGTEFQLDATLEEAKAEIKYMNSVSFPGHYFLQV